MHGLTPTPQPPKPPEDKLAKRAEAAWLRREEKTLSGRIKQWASGRPDSAFKAYLDAEDHLTKIEKDWQEAQQALAKAEAKLATAKGKGKDPSSSQTTQAQKEVTTAKHKFDGLTTSREKATKQWETEYDKISKELSTAHAMLKERTGLTTKNAMESWFQFQQRQRERKAYLRPVKDDPKKPDSKENTALAITRLSYDQLAETLRFNESALEAGRDPKGAWLILLLVLLNWLKHKIQKTDDLHIQAANETVALINQSRKAGEPIVEVDVNSDSNQILVRAKGVDGKYVTLTEEDAKLFRERYQAHLDSDKNYEGGVLHLVSGPDSSATMGVTPTAPAAATTTAATAPAAPVSRARAESTGSIASNPAAPPTPVPGS